MVQINHTKLTRVGKESVKVCLAMEVNQKRCRLWWKELVGKKKEKEQGKINEEI